MAQFQSLTPPRPPGSPPPSALSMLPTEIVIYIFELAASQHKPTAAALARTCKLVREWVEPILYRTVVLHTKAQSELFERTVRSKDPRFFEMYLKHFAPAAGHEELSVIQSPTSATYGHGHGFGIHEGMDHPRHLESGADEESSGLAKRCPMDGPRPPHGWHAIKGVRSLLMSSLCRPTDESTGHARPNEVAIKGFVKSQFFSYPAFSSVTHLFMCEVPMLYVNVLTQIVEALPYLPSLTHLACPFANRWRGPEHSVRAEVCTLLGINPDGTPLLSDANTNPETSNQAPAQPQPNTHQTPTTGRPTLHRLHTNTSAQSSSSSSASASTPTPTPPQTRRALKMLLINVFHFNFPDLERESYIWAQLASIPDPERRLYLQPGETFSVKKWEESVSGLGSRRGTGGDLDVWAEARRSAEGWRSWVRI